MLEQNTDRIYWLIGWVLITAALIGICSVAFPELFDLTKGRFHRMIPMF